MVEADGHRHDAGETDGEETKNRRRERLMKEREKTKVNGVRLLLRNLTMSCAMRMTKTLVQL